jgi:hypothetical protein
MHPEHLHPAPCGRWPRRLFRSTQGGRLSAATARQLAAGALQATMRAGVLALAASALHAAPVAGQGSWETTLHARDVDGDGSVDAYYDSTLDISWLAHANYAAVNSFGAPIHTADGLASHAQGLGWIAAMNAAGHLGQTGWRLPTLSPVNGVAFQDVTSFDGSTDRGMSTPGVGWRRADGTIVSELGWMFYGHLGNSTPCANTTCLFSELIPGLGLVNTGLFEDLMPDVYWTDTALNAFSHRAFNQAYGVQSEYGNFDFGGLGRLWAVHDGDIGASMAVSAPSALALALLALGLAGALPRRVAPPQARPAL